MSYYDWTSQNIYGPLASFYQGTVDTNRTFTPADYRLPATPDQQFVDPVTQQTMSLVGSSQYFDVEYKKVKGGYEWQGTRVDVYKTDIPANSIYYSGPYTNPILPFYENPMQTTPYVLPISSETYKSKMQYDKNLGRYVQVDELIETKQMSYADRIKLGAPDALDETDKLRSLQRRDYYSGAMIGGKK